MGLIQSSEGLNRKMTDLLRTKGNSAWSLPLDSAATFPWASSLPDYPEDFDLASLHNSVSQFLESSLPPHTHMFMHVHVGMHTHTSYCFGFPGALWLMRSLPCSTMAISSIYSAYSFQIILNFPYPLHIFLLSKPWLYCFLSGLMTSIANTHGLP